MKVQEEPLSGYQWGKVPSQLTMWMKCDILAWLNKKVLLTLILGLR